ncbi:histidine kinase [Roseateles asaccharophilus]|uniref:LytS/YehU family sensor histidine kinase n=1 Tax=Roseateles asaccharophilus TaxID=582607 RepID=A0ABU2A5P1_9BURK|nr:histidine kinase [Roseateles asaccharophilus]MDR7332484.1 LytS/YehU family sensor histidine kinase [Roseateles asaccharophilus]
MSLTPAMLRASWRSWIHYQTDEPVGPYWLQWVWTLLFCLGIAVALTALSWLGARWGLAETLVWFGRNLVVSLTIGLCIHLLYLVLGKVFATPERMRGWEGWQRTVYFAGVPMVGVVIGWPLGLVLSGVDISWFAGARGRIVVLSSLATSLCITWLMHIYFGAKARAFQASQQATEAQLRLLQGQIEPHFLFNTLANVQSLIDFDPDRAKVMLERFTDYLRSSLGQMRGEQTTLAHEFAMLEAYLDLMQLRMGERLRVRLVLPAELAEVQLPPLLIQPLVENAIHHGLEPRIDGGQVTITASREAGRLAIDVEDDGHGLDAPRRRPGNGVALGNIRARLEARWGTKAQLELQPREGGGTRARLILPITA